MCENFWIEYGSCVIVNDKVKNAAKLVDDLYETEDGGVGGYGHIVFDDWNLENSNIDFCLIDAGKDEYKLDIETKVASIMALQAFQQLTLEERSSALALHDGYFKI